MTTSVKYHDNLIVLIQLPVILLNQGLVPTMLQASGLGVPDLESKNPDLDLDLNSDTTFKTSRGRIKTLFKTKNLKTLLSLVAWLVYLRLPYNVIYYQVSFSRFHFHCTIQFHCIKQNTFINIYHEFVNSSVASRNLNSTLAPPFKISLQRYTMKPLESQTP